jgi:hypothetical protein
VSMWQGMGSGAQEVRIIGSLGSHGSRNLSRRSRGILGSSHVVCWLGPRIQSGIAESGDSFFGPRIHANER